jgi:hypothetical protein
MAAHISIEVSKFWGETLSEVLPLDSIIRSESDQLIDNLYMQPQKSLPSKPI